MNSNANGNGSRNMRLKNPVVLTLITLVVLGLVTYSAGVVEQSEQSQLRSEQKKISSRPIDYNINYNGSLISYKHQPAPNYLPLFSTLKVMGLDYEWDRSNKIVTIFDGKNTVKLKVGMGTGFDLRNGYQIPSYRSIVLNGEVWVYASETLPLLLGIDHIRWNGEEKQWQIYRFQKQTDRETPLEQASADLVKRYVAIFDSQPPMHSLRDISIESARQLTPTDNLNQGAVKVVVRYTTNYNPHSFITSGLGYPVPGETRHEKVFLAIAEGGKIAIDDVISHRINRTSTGSPIPLLEEEDYIEIGREWQRKSPNASYYDLFLICRDFITPTLTRINTNNNFHLPELDDETVLDRFSEEVRQSQGWQDFLSLKGSKDPYYTILDATYDGRVWEATLVGNWSVNSVNVTPILMEVKLVKDENNSWKFTRLANVRLYKNSRELELSEPETYQKLARLVSYHRDVNMGLGLSI